MQNFFCENGFCLHENKKSFHINGFHRSLPLKQRLGATGEWPVGLLKVALLLAADSLIP